MSLFPAYSSQLATVADDCNNAESEGKKENWLENKSFPLSSQELERTLRNKLSTDSCDSDDDTNGGKGTNETGAENSDSSSSNTQLESGIKSQASISNIDDSDSSYEQEHRKSKNKSGKKSKKTEKSEKEKSVKELEFDGSEEYYVDKKPLRQYLNVDTLYKPACPRYRRQLSKLFDKAYYSKEKHRKLDKKNRSKLERYFRRKSAEVDNIWQENKNSARLTELNTQTSENPSDLQAWITLIELQQYSFEKSARRLLADKRLQLIMRALQHHPSNEQLYRLYIDICSSNYPSTEVTSMLDRLLIKDPLNCTLWMAKIMTTQCTMARCNVPGVLDIYQLCMQKMHHTKLLPNNYDNTDAIMLNLFHNCALFLRQAGHYEKFFALIKLALELNVSNEIFDSNFMPKADDERTLIEYEELVLESGLPMNELWLRIEKIRQAYCFLPYSHAPDKETNDRSNIDPQRVVLIEDVCHYIYPLKKKDNSMHLMLSIVQLTKLPFVSSHCLAERLCAHIEDIGDSDAIENVLAVGLRCSYALPLQREDEFLCGVYKLAKEMSVSPTFLSNNIGHESYERCIRELLLNCASSTNASLKEQAFLLIWCRFERLRLVLERCNGDKLNTEFVRLGRSRFKALLKKPRNRNILNYFTELALYEYEACQGSSSDEFHKVCQLFESIIVQSSKDDNDNNEIALCHAYVCYAEVLIANEMSEQAQQVLVTYALNGDILQKSNYSMSSHAVALKRLHQRLETAITDTQKITDDMQLEDYLLPHRLTTLLRAYCLLQCLQGHALKAISYLDHLLADIYPATNGNANSERNKYFRENIFQLYIVLIQLRPFERISAAAAHARVNHLNKLLIVKVSDAMAEFPRNLHFLQYCGMLSTLPWFKLRAIFFRSQPNIMSIIFIIATARHRFLKTATKTSSSNKFSEVCVHNINALQILDGKYSQSIARNRMMTMFRELATTTTTTSSSKNDEMAAFAGRLKRNALFWRFYLRCLSDETTSFDASKRCLLTALDECPWSKALYLDGATYVPQMVPHIQDLIMEKQLRAYSIAEEIEILRAQ